MRSCCDMEIKECCDEKMMQHRDKSMQRARPRRSGDEGIRGSGDVVIYAESATYDVGIIRSTADAVAVIGRGGYNGVSSLRATGCSTRNRMSITESLNQW